MNGDSLLPFVVVQTLQVTLLAGMVFGLTKFFANDRPHLAHALWALVLLKCLTPPIFGSPTSVFSWMSNGYTSVVYKMQLPLAAGEQSRRTGEQIEGLAPVVVRVTPDRNTTERVDSRLDSRTKSGAVKTDGRTLIAIAIFFWITIAACVFTVSALRLWIFLRRVKKATLPTSANLNQLVESVSERIGLRRKVRIRIVDAAIGPAVVGLIWPTILVPKVIVEGKADTELEPLLAHELIHIRRGDLVWAMLQGMSVSLWWFNPLVWLAERLLTREAERSCDEETIAGLGCSPAIYARSLLDVMERKHQLRAAPSLPGVRPVDITAKRLERIMRLGHGCYRQRPWWVVVVWLIGCAVVLPGAAWVAAQEKAKQEKSVFKEAGFSPELYVQPNRLPSAPVVVDTRIEEKSFQIAEVLERLCKDRNLVKTEAEKELIRILKPAAVLQLQEFEDRLANELKKVEQPINAESNETTTDPSLEECIAIALENIGKSPSAATITIVGEQLRARATVIELMQLERSIEHFRNFGFKSVMTEVAFYEISQPIKFDEVALRNGKLEFTSGADATSNLGVNAIETIRNLATVDDAEIAKFKQRLPQDTVCTFCPRITSLSGQLASLQTGETRNFTVWYKAEKAADGTNDYQPVIRQIQTGLHCEIRAVIVEPTNTGDEQQIELSFHCRRGEIKSVSESKQKFPDTEREFTIEQPIVESQFVDTGCRLKLDQSLVTVQSYKSKTLITIVHCRPMNAAVAAIPSADLTNVDKSAYVTVSDELQSDLETALLKHKLHQHGIKDFRFDDGRLRVKVNEDWKVASNTFQELRSHRNSAEASPALPNPQEQKFNDGNTTYNPIQIYGPVVQGKKLMVRRKVPFLSQVPYITRLFKRVEIVTDDVKQINVPSDEEIVHALEQQQSNRGLASEALDTGQIKITTTKIREFSDPIRFVPLLGDAVLHHVHYKCLLHDVKTDELKSAAYIDYCQFWFAEEVEN